MAELHIGLTLFTLCLDRQQSDSIAVADLGFKLQLVGMLNDIPYLLHVHVKHNRLPQQCRALSKQTFRPYISNLTVGCDFGILKLPPGEKAPTPLALTLEALLLLRKLPVVPAGGRTALPPYETVLVAVCLPARWW